MSSLRELRQLTRIRLLLFWREPEAVFWVFVFPVVLALVLGIAFKGGGVDPSPIGAVEGTLPADWTEALQVDESIELRLFADAEQAEQKLRTGAVGLLVGLDEQGHPHLRFDPARAEAETARLRVEDALQRAAGRRDPLVVSREPVIETGARYIDFLVPGLLGMNLMGTGMWGTGFAIVDMRQKKLLKLFTVTPMRRPSFLLAQILSRFAFLAAEVAVIGCFGVLVLGVPFRGAPLAFAVVCSVGALCFSGLGLLVASRATTIEGVSGLMNFVMMPMWLLSGVFFSYERFPELLHPLIRVLPLTALNDALRGNMIGGEGLLSLAPLIVLQVGWSLLGFGLALWWFRWR